MTIRAIAKSMAQRLLQWSQSADPALDNVGLSPLTPVLLDDEQFAPYEEEFAFVLSNPKIRNIALMGSYGAGKSSVIESWNNRQSSKGGGHSCTFISLATFQDADESIAAIEGEILNQLIHKTKRRNIPKSRFKHTEDNRRLPDLVRAFFILLYGGITVALAFLLARDGLFIANTTEAAHPWLIVVWAFITLILIYRLIREDKVAKAIRRIKVLGNEIELFSTQGDNTDSKLPSHTFDRHMDDVLYLLNNSGSDVIVFEDLDRFPKSLIIFEKLRELNDLVNACRSKRCKTLRFFYLVRDDLFMAPEDRVKFFDFIIPIVPFIDPDSAFDELRQGLKKQGITVSDIFTYELSSFISDSRMLKDIVNETRHYKNHVFRGAQQPLSIDEAEHLVALMAYKVAFPDDFASYQRGKGYVREVLGKRESIVDLRINTLENERDRQRTLIQSIEQRNQFNLDELVLVANCGKINQLDSGIYPSANKIANQTNVPDMIKAIRANESANAEFEQWTEEYLADEENEERFGIPKDTLDAQKQESLKRIQSIDSEIRELRLASFCDLLRSDVIEDAFTIKKSDLKRPDDYEELNLDSIQRSRHLPLLKHLITAGLLDESSIRFAVRVHSKGLSVEDQRNLATLIRRSPIDPDYLFDDPASALLRLRDNLLAIPGAQNYSILKTLLDNQEQNKIAAFVDGLKNGNHASFLYNYVSSDRYNPMVLRIWEDAFVDDLADILTSQEIPLDGKRAFAHQLICDASYWSNKNSSEALRHFVYNDPLFLAPNDRHLDGLKESISSSRLELKLRDIDFSTANGDLMRIAFDQNLYEPNANLVRKWLENFPTQAQAEYQNVIPLLRLPQNEHMQELVSANMDVFLSTFLVSYDGMLSLDEDAIAWVFNSMSPQDELAVDFAARIEGAPCRSLGVIEKHQCKRAAINSDIVSFTPENLLDYYASSNQTIDEALGSFMSKHLQEKGVETSNMKALVVNERFFFDAAISNHLSDEAVAILMKIRGTMQISTFTVDSLTPDRASILYGSGYVAISSNNLSFLCREYPDSEVAFAESNIEDYIHLFQPEETKDSVIEFDEKVGLALLSSSNLTTKNKVELTSLFSSSIRLEPSYPSALKAEIVRRHFDPDDFDKLSSEYDTDDDALRMAILSTINENLDLIQSKGIPFSANTLIALLSHYDFTPDDALALVAGQLELDSSLIGDRDAAKSCFVSAGAKKYVRLLGGKTITVVADELNTQVTRVLIKRGMSSEKSARKSSGGNFIVYPKGYQKSG